jgi:glycosyltransferase involved in cell wall biosynthesis
MSNLSVIICSHNPRPDYLDRVIAALRRQTLPAGQWEFLLVDNASQTPLASRWDLSWHPRARHVSESELGLAVARRRGMRESSGDILVFVDDDNLLAPDYLARVECIDGEWPQLGVWGSGAIDAEFEQQPPPHLSKYLPLLALRKAESLQWSDAFPCRKEATPWGAGQCVRRSVADAYVEHCAKSFVQITGRRGSELTGAEDEEICFVACTRGLGVGTFPELALTHLIPARRVRDEYIVGLIEGTKTSELLLAYKTQGIVPPSPFALSRLPHLAMSLLAEHGFDRRVYFAKLRATIRARSIIAGFGGPARHAGREAQRTALE